MSGEVVDEEIRRIEDDLMPLLPRLPNLTNFKANAAFNRTDADMKALATVCGLERLDLQLGRNKFSSAGLSQLRNLPLTSLYLDPVPLIGDEAVPVLAGMTPLTSLTLNRVLLPYWIGMRGTGNNCYVLRGFAALAETPALR